MSRFLIALIAGGCFAAAAFAQSDPEIMSFREYGAIRHKRPYILNFKTEKGALLYFGIGHAYRADDPQIEKLEKKFLKFRPTLILNESGTPPAAASAAEAVEKYGEPGLLSFLAKKHGIAIKSLDPPRIDEIRYILGTNRWTLEQVFLFYVLRRVAENNKKTNPQPPDAMVEESLGTAAKTPGFENLPKTPAEFEALAKKHFPALADWRKIDSRIFEPNPERGAFTNDIAAASVQFRGKFMVRMLVEAAKKGERVFAVVGASHVVMQERSLKKLLG